MDAGVLMNLLIKRVILERKKYVEQIEKAQST